MPTEWTRHERKGRYLQHLRRAATSNLKRVFRIYCDQVHLSWGIGSLQDCPSDCAQAPSRHRRPPERRPASRSSNQSAVAVPGGADRTARHLHRSDTLVVRRNKSRDEPCETGALRSVITPSFITPPKLPGPVPHCTCHGRKRSHAMLRGFGYDRRSDAFR